MQRFMSLKVTGDKVEVRGPYLSNMPAKARAIGGLWSKDRGVWTFAAQDLDRVRALCKFFYDDDGRADSEISTLATVRFEASKLPGQDFELCGVDVFKRWSRDEAVAVKHVIVIRGGFDSYGGSRKSPTLDVCDQGVTFEMRDLPLHVAEELVARFKASEMIKAEIVDQRPRVAAAPADEAPATVADDLGMTQTKSLAIKTAALAMRAALEAGATAAELMAALGLSVEPAAAPLELSGEVAQGKAGGAPRSAAKVAAQVQQEMWPADQRGQVSLF